MNAMSYVYSSLVNAKLNFKTRDGKPVIESCPRTLLPFTDSTDMEVLGQWLPPRDGEDEFTTFIVRTIEKCDHSLPFKTIDIESLDSYQSSGKVDKESKPIPSRKRRKQGNKPDLTQDEKPSNSIEPEELDFYMQRFSHLQEVEINKIKKVSDNEKRHRYKEDKDPESEDGSTLPGDYSNDNNLQPWQNKINDAESIPVSDRLISVSNAISSILVKRNDLVACCLPEGFVDQSTPFGLYSFERPADKSGNYSWNWVYQRKRKALFLEISKQQAGSVYLLEIEGKGTVGFSLYLMSKPSDSFNVKSLARLLMFDIANRSGSKIVTETMKGFSNVVSLKHVVTDEDSFADRIERAIETAFEE